MERKNNHTDMGKKHKYTEKWKNGVSARDAKRLIQELTERLSGVVEPGDKGKLLVQIRRVFDKGIQAVADENKTVSFKEAAEASIQAREHRRPTTCRDLRHYVRRILRVTGVENRPLRAMKSKECQLILAQAFPNSRHSYNKGRAIMHSIFAYGQRQEWCGDNPVSRLETKAISEKEISPLQPEEIQRLEKAVQKPEHQCMHLSLHLMLYCGLRPQEVARMQHKYIQWEEGRVIVPGACSKTGGGRVVPLRKKYQLQHNSFIIPKNWKARWKALRQAAGYSPGQWVPDVCRHTFASYHAAHFRNLSELQMEMGHRSTYLLRTRYLNLPKTENAESFWGVLRADSSTWCFKENAK